MSLATWCCWVPAAPRWVPKALYALVHQGLGQVAEGLRLHVLENVDPAPITALMERLDPAKTQVLSVSKSGNTAETLAQTLLFMDWFRSQLSEAAFARHFTVLTEAKASALSRLAERFGVTQLAHDPQIGGRFSVLSIVGLLPALALGIDAEAIRAGANAVLAPALAGDRSHAALKGAAWALHHQLAGRNLAVLLPYADQLADFGLWYRQLWAESLGKDGLGSTPIRAMGTVDQHSQLQLYLDGPADKTFSFIALDARGQGPNIPSDLGDDSLSYLTGHRLGDLLYAEARASADTFNPRGPPGALDDPGADGCLYPGRAAHALYAGDDIYGAITAASTPLINPPLRRQNSHPRSLVSCAQTLALAGHSILSTPEPRA